MIDSSIYFMFKFKQDKNANIVHFVYHGKTRFEGCYQINQFCQAVYRTEHETIYTISSYFPNFYDKQSLTLEIL